MTKPIGAERDAAMAIAIVSPYMNGMMVKKHFTAIKLLSRFCPQNEMAQRQLFYEIADKAI